MIAGLDLSTRALDFVVIDPDDPARCEHRRVELPSPWWEAARRMGDILSNSIPNVSIIGQLHQNRASLLGIERPYGAHRQAIASLHTILGAVLATVPPWIQVLEIRPAEMRKELGLPGNASKERMHEAVWLASRANMNWPPDALDAWAAAHAAMRMCERAAEKGAA